MRAGVAADQEVGCAIWGRSRAAQAKSKVCMQALPNQQQQQPHSDMQGSGGKCSSSCNSTQAAL